jgi:ribose 5-phosphate isomerase B
MRVAIGADHAGFELKNSMRERLEGLGHSVEDLGTHSGESADYPDYARAVAVKVASGAADLGVVVCGTGIGTDIAANKIRGVRCARGLSEFDARFARLHNDANVLSLGARVTGTGLAEAILDTFVGTEFEGGRHARRVAKIEPEGG